MSDPIGQLTLDHQNFARLLDVLDGQLNLALDPDAKADFALMQDIMTYMTYYPDQYHHPKEDLIFTALVVREPAARGIVSELRMEHRTLAGQGQRLLDTLRGITDGALVQRSTLESAGRDYVTTLRSHMDIEQGKVFRQAGSRLDDNDWMVISREIERLDDPLFGDVVSDDYRRLFEVIMRAESKQ